MEESRQQGCIGLFVPSTNVPVPLTAVNYDFRVTGFASLVTINQTYKNEETTDLECVYGFPMNDQAGIVGFTVKIDDRVLVSQFKKKDEAFKEYTEAISRGDGAYLLDQSDRSDDTFVMSVGRLPPQKECTVSISYACTLESVTEIKMRLVIPMSLSPRYNPKPEKTPSGVAPPEKYQAKVPYLATLAGTIHAVDVIQSVTSPTHPLKVSLVGQQDVSVEFGAQQQPLDRDLIVEIEVKNNPEHYVDVEMNSPGKYTAMYAFMPRLTKESSVPVNTELIFLVDCSGSMQEEGKIDEARRAMQIFLRSVPEGCYFNFYRFGSTFESLFSDSQLYSADSFTKAKEYAAKTTAELGGTEILAPLEKIFSQASRPGFSRQLFVLTDGDVSNTTEVTELVRRNANNTRVFSFGLGHSPSRSLVNGIALAGNGKSEFIKLGEVLEDKIGRHLNRALQPAVTGATVTWNSTKNVQQAPSKLPPVFHGDRQLVFAFFELEDAKQSPSITVKFGGSSLEVPVPIPAVQAQNGKPVLAKLAARALIKEIEYSPFEKSARLSGSQQERQVTAAQNDVKEGIQKKVTEISLEHGVMSQWVSLVAVEHRDEAERAKASPEMQLREIPIQKLGNNRLHGPPGMAAWQMMCCSAPRMKRSCAPSRARAPQGMMSMLACKAKAVVSYLDTNPVASSQEMDVEEVGDQVDDMFASISDEADSTEEDAPAAVGSPLHRLLDLQQWDGSWTFSTDMETITGLSLAKVKEAVSSGMDDAVLATILAVGYLKERHADQVNVWQAIVNKAAGFLAKHTDPAVLSSVTLKVVGLISKA